MPVVITRRAQSCHDLSLILPHTNKMKTVLAAIRTENIGALRTMYLSGDDEVVEGELIDDEPNATVITPEAPHG